jgi:hypothetical protein
MTANRLAHLSLPTSEFPAQRLPCVPDRIEPNVAFSPSESRSRPVVS